MSGTSMHSIPSNAGISIMPNVANVMASIMGSAIADTRNNVSNDVISTDPM